MKKINILISDLLLLKEEAKTAYGTIKVDSAEFEGLEAHTSAEKKVNEKEKEIMQTIILEAKKNSLKITNFETILASPALLTKFIQGLTNGA